MMRLPHRIKLQKATTSQDAHGQPIETWATKHNVWAEITDTISEERGDNPIVGVAVTKFVIRYIHAGEIPDARWRIVMAEGELTRTWNIEAVRRLDSRRRFLELRAVEAQA